MNIEPITWQAAPQDISLKKGEIHVWMISAESVHHDVKEVLAKYTHQAPQDMVLAKTESGKPYLKNFPDIHFNLSHTHELALCVVSHFPVGVDVEYVDKEINYLGIAKRYFSAAECELISSQKAENQKLTFLKLWTQKEAYLKSRGMKISSGLEKAIPEKGEIFHFEPMPRYLAAVASTLFSTVGRISCYRLSELLH